MPSVFTCSTSDFLSSSVSVSNLVEDGYLSGSKSPRFAHMATNFSVRSFLSLLWTFEFSQIVINCTQSGNWRRMKAPGARASDPQSYLHQVDGGMCLVDCQIPAPSLFLLNEMPRSSLMKIFILHFAYMLYQRASNRFWFYLNKNSEFRLKLKCLWCVCVSKKLL